MRQMAETAGPRALWEAQGQLQEWRRQHGGPGVRIPEELWELAVRAAQVDGVEAAARALRLDSGRLSQRTAMAGALAQTQPAPARFVEVELGAAAGAAAQSAGEMVVELAGADGERMRIVLRTGDGEGILALARAFWRRER